MAELGSSNQSMYNSQRSTFLHGVYRSKMTLGEPLFNESEVLCRLISAEEYDSYRKFIGDIPRMISDVVKGKVNAQILPKEVCTLDIDRNL